MSSCEEYKVFYRDYKHDVSISSAKAEPLAADRLVPLAEKLLCNPDNFLGIEDDKASVLQLYATDADNVVLELMYSDADGCMQLKCSWQQAMTILEKLPSEFGDDLLIGACYVG